MIYDKVFTIWLLDANVWRLRTWYENNIFAQNKNILLYYLAEQ